MSTTPTLADTYSDFERTYVSDLLERDFHGAFLSAIRYRTVSSDLTQSEIARRCGKRKEQISRLMSEPRNLELDTIAVVANALDLEFRYVFVDRIGGRVAFNGRGMHHLDEDGSLDQLMVPNYARQWSVTTDQMRRLHLQKSNQGTQAAMSKFPQQNRVGASSTTQQGV